MDQKSRERIQRLRDALVIVAKGAENAEVVATTALDCDGEMFPCVEIDKGLCADCRGVGSHRMPVLDPKTREKSSTRIDCFACCGRGSIRGHEICFICSGKGTYDPGNGKPVVCPHCKGSCRRP